MSSPIEVQGFEIDIDALPAESVRAMIARGLRHYLGNEVASKVSAWKDKNPDADSEAVAEFKAEARDAAVKALHDGTMGHRTVTPRGTPIEALMRQIAEGEVKTILTKAGLALPTAKKPVTLKGESFTMADLVKRRLGTDGDRIRQAAEDELARRNEAAESDGDVADALGL